MGGIVFISRPFILPLYYMPSLLVQHTSIGIVVADPRFLSECGIRYPFFVLPTMSSFVLFFIIYILFPFIYVGILIAGECAV
ncbi:hypothetical protein F5B17DRAFT_211227 [Nemania serpens]|nr:hypothetical protein F5B17DRAFT_211227 [Nemania serpens]